MQVKVLFITLILIIFPITVLATSASNLEIYNGIDVSNWQGYIDYSAVKENKIDIVYIKSSQGNNIIDSYFKINYQNAKANNLKVGFYHFLTARNEEEARNQADFFCSVISNTNPDCKLAMDFEVFGNLSIEEINKISEIFLERVKEITGKDVIIYSDLNNARNVFSKELSSKYPLWVAEYGVIFPGISNWEYWEGFQYTDMYEVNGIRGYTDGDRFTNDIFLDNNSGNLVQENNDIDNSKDVYIVKKGNILSCIALEYNTTVKELVILNNITNPNLIYPGEKIIVPINGNSNNESEYHLGKIVYKVKAGDTLSEIAEKYNTTVDEIAKLNNIKNVNLIFVGERLRINI